MAGFQFQQLPRQSRLQLVRVEQVALAEFTHLARMPPEATAQQAQIPVLEVTWSPVVEVVVAVADVKQPHSQVAVAAPVERRELLAVPEQWPPLHTE